MKTRIYEVKGNDSLYLVEAASAARAIAHVVTMHGYQARVLSALEVARMSDIGVKTQLLAAVNE